MNVREIRRIVSDGVDRAKAGDALSVYAELMPLLDDGSMPSDSHYAFGWIIYYALHTAPSSDISGRKNMLARYLKLDVEKPHKLHSMILTEAIRLYRDSIDTPPDSPRREPFSILRFAAIWQLANLRPGDWRRKEVGGNILSSTVEKLITCGVDEAERCATLPDNEFMMIVDRAVGVFADSFNLMAQRASLHIISDEKPQAASLLRKATMLAPGKFFLWSRLAELTDSATQTRLHVALLYKALLAPGPEQFKGKIRLSLATALAGHGAATHALRELELIEQLYTANGWHLSPSFRRLRESIPPETKSEDPTPLYRRLEPLADEYLYSELPAVEAVKTYHKPPCRGRNGIPAPAAWRVTASDGNHYWFQPHRFSLAADLPSGTRLTIRICAGKVVAAQLR